MKKLTRKLTLIATSITLLFSVSVYGQLKNLNSEREKLKKKIEELNKQIKAKTTNKARLQRNRDQLLRKLKELTPTQNPRALKLP